MKHGKIQYLLLAAAGGIVEAFSLMRLDGVFPNVQTANLLLCVLAFLQGNYTKASLFAISLAAYLLGSMLCSVIGERLYGRNGKVISFILAETILITAMLISELWKTAAVFLLAFLCGFCFEGLCIQMEKINLSKKHELVLAFTVGVLLGALLLPVSGSYVLIMAGVLLILSQIPTWRKSEHHGYHSK